MSMMENMMTNKLHTFIKSGTQFRFFLFHINRSREIPGFFLFKIPEHIIFILNTSKEQSEGIFLPFFDSDGGERIFSPEKVERSGPMRDPPVLL